MSLRNCAHEAKSLKDQLAESVSLRKKSELDAKNMEKANESVSSRMADLELNLKKSRQETSDLKDASTQAEKRLEDAEHAAKVSKLPGIQLWIHSLWWTVSVL